MARATLTADLPSRRNTSLLPTGMPYSGSRADVVLG